MLTSLGRIQQLKDSSPVSMLDKVIIVRSVRLWDAFVTLSSYLTSNQSFFGHYQEVSSLNC